MSIVTLPIGQAGNQIFSELFHVLAEIDPDYDVLFRKIGKSPVSRSVLIDMEPKVIQKTRQLVTQIKSFKFDSYYFKQSGSANNWGFGFMHQGPNNQKPIFDLIRKEVEKCDRLEGFLMMHSLAGGTGSGLGSWLTQELRDLYNSSMMNQVVWPYENGEVIIQNYNALLTLSKLYEHSDGILVFENDMLSLTCQQLLGIKRPSFADMNKVVAKSMANFLIPSFRSENNKYQKCRPLFDVLTHLCSHPAYKFITIKNIPQVADNSKSFSTYQWHGLMKHLFQMQITDAKIEENVNWRMKISSQHINKSVANFLICRGDNLEQCIPHLQSFRSKELYPSWTCPNNRFQFHLSSDHFQNQEKSAMMLTNSQSLVNPLNQILTKASEMFNVGGYLHHFKNYKIDEEHFQNIFCNMEQVLYDYKCL